MRKKFVIFLNGEYKYSQEFMDRLVSEETICFCADGGANFAFQYGKVPEMIIGDLDSIEKKVLEYYKSKNVLIKKFPRDKDFTDFELILEEINKILGNEDFIEKIFIVGGLGNRLDMTLSNLFLMEKYKNIVFLLEDEEIFYAEKSFVLKSKNVLIKKFPRDKDFTDFELILEEINKISENEDFVEKIFVVGGLGNRLDMTLSNLFLMEKYKNIVFLLEDEEIFYVEKPFALKNKKNFEFSIVPISENVEKLTLKGFKFETDGIDVKRESSRLVSNVICENEASVEFESGKLIIILKNKYF